MNDESLLATLVTAWLISEGGSFLFTKAEWEQALEHAGTLFIQRHDDDDGRVLVMLVPAQGARA